MVSSFAKGDASIPSKDEGEDGGVWGVAARSVGGQDDDEDTSDGMSSSVEGDKLASVLEAVG
jgi:hypothetical protein